MRRTGCGFLMNLWSPKRVESGSRGQRRFAVPAKVSVRRWC